MQSITVKERFRPARIAFVVPRNDPAALARAVELNTVLLGGMFNPIIPYSAEGQDEAIQMLHAFDPDLIHSIADNPLTWVPESHQPRYPSHYCNLYHTRGDNGIHDFAYQDVQPVYALLWREIARIEKTTPFIVPIISAAPTYHLLYKTIFGSFPTDFEPPYERIYRDYLKPDDLCLTDVEPLQTTDPWPKASPLRLTTSSLHSYSTSIDLGRFVFIGDPLDTDSLTDFWNLRAAGNEVLFIPLSHYQAFGQNIQEMYKTPHTLRIWTHVPLFFSRSTSEKCRQSVSDWFTSLFPSKDKTPSIASICAGYWTSHSSRPDRSYYAEEAETLVPTEDGKFQYQTAFPKWLRPQERGLPEKLLYVDPSFQGVHYDNYLTYFPRDPGIEERLERWCAGQKGRIADAGLSFLRSPLYRNVHMSLPTGEEAIEAVFHARNMRIKLSEPGHVAKQIMARLGGINKCRLFKVKAVREALHLLRDGKAHARQEILKTLNTHLSAGPSDLFIESGKPYVAPGKSVGSYTDGELLELMHRLGMIEQGWRLKCKTCSMYAWYPVSDLSHDFVCRWCFAKQATPQLVCNRDVTYAYRASGLYLTHGEMKGSVPVIITLWRLLNCLGYFERSVYTASVEVREGNAEGAVFGELDFAVLMPRAGPFGFKLVIGEARGKVDYAENEFLKVRRIGQRFGEDFIEKHLCACVSTLKDKFSDEEKRLLRALADDGYEVLPFTRLDLDPYDLNERFQTLPHRYVQTLQQLAGNLRTLNMD